MKIIQTKNNNNAYMIHIPLLWSPTHVVVYAATHAETAAVGYDRPDLAPDSDADKYITEMKYRYRVKFCDESDLYLLIFEIEIIYLLL